MRMRAAADCEHSPARAARLAGPSTRSGDRATSGLRRAAEYGTELRQKHMGVLLTETKTDRPPATTELVYLGRVPLGHPRSQSIKAKS